MVTGFQGRAPAERPIRDGDCIAVHLSL